MSAPFTLPEIPDNSILGLSYSGMHDSAIAIVAPDGDIVFAISLERISRVKQDGRYPSLLLDQIPWDKIAKVALSVEESYLSGHDVQSLHHPRPLEVVAAVDRAHGTQFAEYLAKLDKALCFVPHHLSHAASAFWMSDFEESLCFVYDGGMANEEWFGGLYQADRTNNLSILDRFGAQRYANVTYVYTAVTAVLGFSPLKHEGKITGLAAYGTPNAQCDAVLERWLMNPRMLDNLLYWENMYSEKEVPQLKASLAKIAELKQDLVDVSREDLAFAVQALAEKHVLEILTHWRDQGNELGNICLSGGLFANVKINQRISELGFEKLFVSPPMSDDGTALGAALHIASLAPSFSAKRAEHVFLGAGSTADYVTELIEAQAIKTVALDEEKTPAARVAQLLDQGKIVAVYQGASEFGPRALGNRSILANADDPDINRSLNEHLNRTEFMPFAPMCLKEDAQDYFENIDKVEHAAEFMTVTVNCTDLMKELCPAVVHCDGTARPQLVTAQSNPFIFDVLSIYKSLNGKPAIVNTSFNVHEEPIICSAEDAFKGFFESGLDYLYIEGHIVALADNKALEIEFLRRKMADLRGTIKDGRRIMAEQYDKKNEINGMIAIKERAFAAEMAEAKAAIELRDTEVQRLFEQSNELSEHIGAQNKHITWQEQLVEERDQAISDMATDIAHKTQEIANKNQEISDNTHLINSIYNSSSWKITRPLRAFFGLFKSK